MFLTDGQLCVGMQIEWNVLQRCLGYDILTTIKGLSAPGIAPGGSAREVHCSLTCSLRQDWSYQQVWTKKKLIIDTRTCLIVGKIEEQSAHRRNAFLMGSLALLQ